MYYYAPYIIGLPQAILNTIVAVILLEGFVVLRQKFNPGLIYLLNLAMSDVNHAIILSLITSLYQPVYCYREGQEEEETYLERETGCKLYVTSWSFCLHTVHYSNSASNN